LDLQPLDRFGRQDSAGSKLARLRAAPKIGSIIPDFMLLKSSLCTFDARSLRDDYTQIGMNFERIIGARKIRPFAVPLGFVIFAWGIAGAQANPAPQKASQAASQEQASEPQKNDYSGMYSFLREGEFVQITVEGDGRVIGLVSRYVNEDPEPRDEEGGTFVDQLFKSGKLEGTHLSFVTEELDGITYEFRGEIERGEGKVRTDEGYYVVKGTLTETKTDSAKKTSSSSRDVVLKSFSPDLGSPPGKSK
jgi:hypothetical protein